MAKWNNTFKMTDLIEGIAQEELTTTKMQSIAVEISKRLNIFIEEQKDRIKETHWINVMAEFNQLAKDKNINIDLFDGVLDNMYDLADDDKVWVE